MMSRMRPRRLISRYLLAVLGVASACVHITDPPLPGGARILAVPELYARWWAMAESCAGVIGSLEAVTWYEVPNASSVPLNGRQVGAYWSRGSNRIVVAGNSALEGGLLRHEMLHALTLAGHSRELYLGACAGVVNCDSLCVADAGPPPPPHPASALVPPESLTVSVEVASGPRLLTADGEYLAIIVTAQNHSARPVIVDLPLAGQNHRLGFVHDVRGPTGGWKIGIPSLDPSRWTFAAGERKREVFDVYSTSELGVERFPAGDYLLRGSFGGFPSDPVTLHLGP